MGSSGKHVRGKGKAPTSPARVRRAERKARALEMRVAGASSVEIAQVLGMTRAGAWKLISKALNETKAEISEKTEELRSVQATRIEGDIRDMRQRAKEDPGIYKTIRGYYERQAKLLNLDLTPEDGDGHGGMVIELRFPGERGEGGDVVDGQAEDVPPAGELGPGDAA